MSPRVKKKVDAKRLSQAHKKNVPPAERRGFPVVAIGASAGGLEALTKLFARLPERPGMALVVIQHLDPNHDSMVTEILSRATPMPVTEVKDGVPIERDHVYVIPPNFNMAMNNGLLKLYPRPQARGLHLPVDFFFQSLAIQKRSQAVGVVLSGTASDGANGICAIKAEGGITFAQDPKTASYDGMPKTSIATGNVDFILPPQEIADELMRVAAHPYLYSVDAMAEREEEVSDIKPGGALNIIFSQLLRSSRVDFSHYKHTTVRRRIARRMVLLKIGSLGAYAAYLKLHPEEVDALFSEILIHVTEFFRDPKAFKALKTRVFPYFMNDKPKGAPVRVWVPGCATGEEAYSIAMSLFEFLGNKVHGTSIQIFASDISEHAITRARSGLYPNTITQHVSKERLHRFFVRTPDGQYRINKQIRDLCLFSKHDLTNDPPFAKMDLISCRNVLIYFDGALQKKVIPLLHYSLNPNGFLWMGKSESVSGFQGLFSQADKINKFFAKKTVVTPSRFQFPTRGSSADKSVASAPKSPINYNISTEAQKDGDRIILTKYGPPGVLVNDDLEIIQFRGRTAPFLEPLPGQANLNLMKMLRPELMPVVRTLFQTVKKQLGSARREGLVLDHSGQLQHINLEVVLVNSEAGPRDRYYLVLFEPADTSIEDVDRKTKPGKGYRAPPTEKRAVSRLRQDLKASKEQLQAFTEEYEATQEELTSSNEELQSTNEELQSTNEELETAKEELQSTNEELTTVNEELQHRNLELSGLNNDLINLLGSVEIPIVMISNDHRIRRFTPKASKVLNVIPTDVGRPVGDIKPNIDVADLDQLISEVIQTMRVHESEVRSRDGKWYRLQIRPYRTTENKIDGVVLTLLDIDVIKRNLDEMTLAERRHRALLETALDAIVIVNQDGKIEFINKRVEDWFGYSSSELIGLDVELLMPDRFKDKHIFQQEKYGSSPVPRMAGAGLELYGKRKDGTEFPIDVAMSAVQGENGAYVTAIIRDITDRLADDQKRESFLASEQDARKVAEDANQAKDIFLATLSHELRTPLTAILSWSQLLQRKQLDKAGLRRGLENIESNAKSQGQLIDDLLDISRIMAGKLVVDPRNVDPTEVISAAVEMVKPLVDKKSQALKVVLQPLGGTIYVDPFRLQQVLWNLLTNSIKFTPERGKITVALESRGGTAAISVTDTGRGFPTNFASKIFERFVQADAPTTRNFGGLGLGLSLVKRLVEIQRGTVEAVSPGEGKGSTFTVEFPIQMGVPVSPQPSGPDPYSSKDGDGDGDGDDYSKTPKLKGIRVLFVDDERMICEAISALLAELGARVEVAYSASQALTSLIKNPPDVIVTDIAMPGEDGFSLLRKIRRSDSTKAREIPVIAMTAFAGSADKRKTLEAGFSAYVSKPVNMAYLASEVARLNPSKRVR